MGLTYELHIFGKDKYTYEYSTERGAYVVYNKITGDEFNTYTDDFFYVADNERDRWGCYTINEMRGFNECETELPGEFNNNDNVFVIIMGH